MTYINIDLDDYLDEVSTKSLECELERRRKAPVGNYYIPKAQAAYALDQAVKELRKIGRVDIAYKLDEIKVDYIQ